MTTTTKFRFKVLAIASLLGSSILIVILVAQRPDITGGGSVAQTSQTLARTGH